MEKMNTKKMNRKIHRWLGIFTAIPMIIILSTGVLLLLKKDISWIQPSTQKGSSKEVKLHFDDILNIVSKLPDINLKHWEDINRLDIRPNKGIIKVRGNNNWEVQLDSKTGKVLQIAERRSDIIESIHDGTFFHKHVKLWIFLPMAILLIILWITGLYLFSFSTFSKKSK